MIGTVLMVAGLTAGAIDVPAELGHLGFDDDDRARLRRGGIVAAYPERDLDKEITVAVAMVLPDRVEDVVAAIRDDEPTGRVIEHHVIEGDGPDEFAKVAFARGDRDETDDLADVEPGSDFNLSTGEIRRLAAAPRRSVGEAYRTVLHERYRGYRQRGLAGIVPYDRDDGDVTSPAEELASATRSDRRLLRHFPGVGEALISYPQAPEGLEHRFAWIKQTVEERPHFVLEHRVIDEAGPRALIVERQLFVGHSYNSAQWVCVVVETDHGTLVLCTQRTFTDLVDGIGTSVRHRLGRSALKDEVLARMRSIRSTVRKGRGARPAP